MSLLQIPKTSHFAFFRGKISTALNLGFFPVAGQYQDQSITLSPQAVYLISDLTFSTNASEADFQEGLSDPANPADPGQELSAKIRRTNRGDILHRYPFRLNIYLRQSPLQIWFETTTLDTLTISANGIIRQTAGMVADGIDRLDVFLNFRLYEIEDQKFKKLWCDP